MFKFVGYKDNLAFLLLPKLIEYSVKIKGIWTPTLSEIVRAFIEHIEVSNIQYYGISMYMRIYCVYILRFTIYALYTDI